MSGEGAVVAVRMGFVPASVAVPDPDHPGLLRAGPRASAPYDRSTRVEHECPATDLCRDPSARPDLLTFGFDTVDLSGFEPLQHVLARVREAGHVTDEDVATIRGLLEGAVLPCTSGRRLRLLLVAEEGFLMRTSGPDGLPVAGPRAIGANGHGAATSVHADQDVYGTPLAQLMDGRAPSLLRHTSPDGENHDAGLMLVNLWIPLQQITQPLVLADGRSIDRRRHQLRYGLATQSFLERDEETAINDIWTFLHDPGQRWYLRSRMDHRSAYAFDTLSTAHGACALPGEQVAARCYRSLEEAEAAVARGDAVALVAALPPTAPTLAPDVPPALRAAIDGMVAVADEARRGPDVVCGERSEAWSAASRAARRRVVRMSLELRVVVSVDTRR